MLTTIVALSIPYVIIRTPKQYQIDDLSCDKVQALVTEAASDATIESGGGGSAYAKYTCLVPASKSDDFFSNLREVVKKHIGKGNWDISEKWSTETSFSYHLRDTRLDNGNLGRCVVVGVLLEKKKGQDLLYKKEVDEITFSIHTFELR